MFDQRGTQQVNKDIRFMNDMLLTGVHATWLSVRQTYTCDLFTCPEEDYRSRELIDSDANL